MQEALLEEKVVKIASVNGINVYHIKTGKFKTNTINIFFHDTLSRETAALNALIPAVLRRGCRSLPTFQQIALYLEELYGASFDCGVAKKGERQIVQFYIEFISDRYTSENNNLFEKAFELLFEIVTNPVLENGVFKTEYLEQEKENLKKLIASRVNDKMQYAVEKCFEEMCKDEPFGVYEYGTIQDVERIENGMLYSRYREFVETLPVDVYFTGIIEDDKLGRVIEKLSGISRKNIKNVEKSRIDIGAKDVKHVTEKMDVNQGKLTLGFRTNTSPDNDDYYKLLIYNGILGGGGFMHSKLFQNVREKESLAYYVFSRLEKYKGLMAVSSGIEIKNKDRAIEIILKQMDEIKKGNISDYELEATLKTSETGIKSLKDSQLQMVDFYLSQSIAGIEDNFDEMIQKAKRVTRQDVVEIAGRIKLDTIYFLTSRNKG